MSIDSYYPTGRFWVLFVSLSYLVVLTGCHNRPILVGFVGPLTGSSSDLGVQGRNGATLAFEEINAAGGVARRPLQLLARDDRNDADRALVVDQELVMKGVVAIIGHMTSAPSVAAVTLGDQDTVPYISPTSSSPTLSGRDDMFIRIQGASDRPAYELGLYIARENPGVRVSVILDGGNEAYTELYGEAFIDGLGDGGEIVYYQSLDIAGIEDWAPVIEAIDRSQPNAVMIVAAASDTARFAQAVRGAGRRWILLGSGWAATAVLSTYGGRAIEGLLVARSVSALMQSERGIAFRDRYFERFGREPSFAAAQAYDAAFLLTRALRLTGGSAQGLKEAILGIGPFETFAGTIELDRYGDVKASAVILRYQGSAFVPVSEGAASSQ